MINNLAKRRKTATTERRRRRRRMTDSLQVMLSVDICSSPFASDTYAFHFCYHLTNCDCRLTEREREKEIWFSSKHQQHSHCCRLSHLSIQEATFDTAFSGVVPFLGNETEADVVVSCSSFGQIVISSHRSMQTLVHSRIHVERESAIQHAQSNERERLMV